MKYYIVSLAWNKYDMTAEFLQRLKKGTDIPFKLVFTDNGSEEPIPNLVRQVFPDAELIINEENIGCPATRNLAMEKIEDEEAIVFWLDNDTMVEKGWYEPFLDKLEDKGTGLVGVDGRRVAKPFNPQVPWDRPNQFLPDPNVDWFVGFAVAFRKKAYRPILDWNLMVNMDDVDLGVGIKSKGYKAKMIKEPVALKHLVTGTGAPIMPNRQEEIELMEKWWDYWKKYKSSFVNYE